MTRATAFKRRGSLRRASFDSMLSPIPGNVFACMEELGIEAMRQIEDEISGKCPMHMERIGKEDRHSSWSVNAEEGYFNCFSCGYKGPFVLLVKDLLGVEWADAVQWVRERGTIERVKRRLGYGLVEEAKSGPVDTSQRYTEAHLGLFTDPPQWALDKKNVTLAAAQVYGVLWDPKNDAWITPIRMVDGTMMGWQEKNERYFRNKPRDVKKSRTLFGIDVFDGGTAIVVESPLDTARIFSAGVSGALSSFGSAVSQEQIDLIIDGADAVIFALDADKSGDQQHEYLRKYFMSRGFPCKFMDYSHVPAGTKDPGDMTDEEILIGIENAYSGVVARFAHS